MTLDDLMQYLLPELPGCPDPTVRLAILRAAREFCNETLAWTETQDPVLAVDGTSTYDVDLPSGSSLVMVRDVFVGNRRLTPVTVASLQTQLPAWQTAQASEPSFYRMTDDRTGINVYPIPLNANSVYLVIRAAYAPKPSATTLPDILGGIYLDAITSGVKANLMAMPNTNWTNPGLSAYYQGIFKSGKQTAKEDQFHEGVQGPVFVTPRPFGF